MKLSRVLPGVVGVVILCCSAYAGVSADDFLPPVQAETDERAAELRAVRQPGEITIAEDAALKKDVVTAATAQDAVNKVAQAHEVGCRMVRFPSGFGFVATGAGSYQHFPNPSAARISKRNAYVIAFMNAQGVLAETLKGLSSEGKTMIYDSLRTSNTETTASRSSETAIEESVEQAVRALLKGFVVYDVKDDPDKSMVYVTVVTTPKTRGKFDRVDIGAVESETLREGLDAVLAEIRYGIVPPVGGRIVTCAKTGEVAFVGFGSAVVESDEDAAMQAKLNLSAEKVSRMRALDALCGTILGDDVTKTSKFIDCTDEFARTYTDYTAAENSQSDSGAQRSKQVRAKAFSSVRNQQDVIQSARKGQIPPGVTSKTWRDEENGFAYTASVYLPRATAEAVGAAEEMENAQIVQPYGQNVKKQSGESAVPGRLDEGKEAKPTRIPTVERPSDAPVQGPTGQVQNPDSL